jgi:hypothetical protein
VSYHVRHAVYDEDGYEVGYTTAPVDRDDVVFVGRERPRRALTFTERDDDSALEALADRMVAKRAAECPLQPRASRDELRALIGRLVDAHFPGIPMGPVQGFMSSAADAILAGDWENHLPQRPRPCCHTTGPHHHPACDQPEEGK